MLETALYTRRRGSQLALLAGCGMVAVIDWRGDWLHLPGHGRHVAYAVWLVVNAVTLLPIIAGAIAAGRFSRDRRPGVAELQGTAIAHPWSLALARYLGAAGPSLVAGALLTAVMAVLALLRYGPGYALITLQAASVMLAPALLVAVALGLAFGALLPVRVAQGLVAAVWVWALLGAVKGMPSIGHTPLDPTVAYARRVLFHTDALMASGGFHPAATKQTLVVNLLAVAAIVAGALALVAWRERPR